MSANQKPVKRADGKYDHVDFSKATGFRYPPVKCAWNKRETLLFANAIGCQADERHFLYELHPKFSIFPTFPVNLNWKQQDMDVYDFLKRSTTADVPGVPPFDGQRSVDGERTIEILKQLPVSSEGHDFEIQNKVVGVYDKGGAMILEAEQELVDVNTSTVYAKIASTAFGIGQGGYGGPRGPSKTLKTMPKREPDGTHVFQTTAETPLLYRLCGDYNPMHADENFGRKAGFKGSINHGLLTWNIAARGLLRVVGDSDPRRFRAYGARFKSVVYPGDALRTNIWKVGERDGCDEYVFETVVEGDGRVALSNGFARIQRGGAKL